jgi:hypothetical protein
MHAAFIVIGMHAAFIVVGMRFVFIVIPSDVEGPPRSL